MGKPRKDRGEIIRVERIDGRLVVVGPAMKVCKVCGLEKLLTEFHMDRKAKDGLQNFCMHCNTQRSRQWDKNNPERAAATSRRGNLSRLYNMTEEEYQRRYEEQEGRCAICKKEDPKQEGLRFLEVDHSHRTLKNRGLLCNKCNRGLSNFDDCIAFMRNGIAYLEHYNEPQDIQDAQEDSQ